MVEPLLPQRDGYTPEAWLDSMLQRYGGVDSLLLWVTCAPVLAIARARYQPLLLHRNPICSC